MVITETPTAMGYKKSLVTFSDKPSVAIMNENSPIWERLIPACKEVLSGCPEMIAPTATNRVFPKITTNTRMAVGRAYSNKSDGLISIPTEIKKIAPNRSLTGLSRCSIFSAWVVSARIEPIINAPKAAEKPA